MRLTYPCEQFLLSCSPLLTLHPTVFVVGSLFFWKNLWHFFLPSIASIGLCFLSHRCLGFVYIKFVILARFPRDHHHNSVGFISWFSVAPLKVILTDSLWTSGEVYLKRLPYVIITLCHYMMSIRNLCKMANGFLRVPEGPRVMGAKNGSSATDE